MADDTKPRILHPVQDWVEWLSRPDLGDWDDLSAEEQEELDGMFSDDEEEDE